MEETEARGHGDWIRSAPAEYRTRYGLAERSDEGVHCFAAGAFDVLALNVVIVTGAGRPASAQTIESWKQVFREAGARRFFVQVSPAADPERWEPLLLGSGLRAHNRWARLWRVRDPRPEECSGPRVERIGRDEGAVFARLVAEGFNMPAETQAWLAAPVGRSGWQHYVAFEADEPIGAAVLVTGGPMGWLSFAATREDRRGRGAQSALIRRRLTDAFARGCTHLAVETAEDKPEKPAPSFRNLRRFGFRFAYYRPNYLFEFAPTVGARAGGPSGG